MSFVVIVRLSSGEADSDYVTDIFGLFVELKLPYLLLDANGHAARILKWAFLKDVRTRI
jgi:hypothetical protein